MKEKRPNRNGKRNEHGMNTTKDKSGEGKRKAARVVWSLRLYIAGETPVNRRPCQPAEDLR